jgi:CHAT domain-containing protein
VSAVVGTLWPVDDLAALIYGQELHVQLSAGTDLLVAHHRAVNVLRTGKVDGPSATRLSEVRPSWRTELEGIALNEPYWWAPFRLSGRCWS